MAHVRHRQGLGLAGRCRRHGISGARSAGRRLRARALRRAVLAHRRGQDLPAAVRRPHDELWRRPAGAAHLCGRRPHRPRHPAHALRPVAEEQRAVLHRVFRARPDHGAGRHLHRRRRLEPRRRHHPPLFGQDGGAGDRRLWPRLFLGDVGAHLHRRRRRHGRTRRLPAAGHGVRAVPPDRHLWRRLPDHRRRARRGRLSRQFRGRALHGALCAVGQGPCLARRRLALHDAGDPRRPRRRQEEGPHLPASRPSRSGGSARAAARHFGIGKDLCRRRPDQGADPGAADGALQYGRRADQLLGRGARTRRRRTRTGCRPG